MDNEKNVGPNGVSGSSRTSIFNAINSNKKQTEIIETSHCLLSHSMLLLHAKADS